MVALKLNSECYLVHMYMYLNLTCLYFRIIGIAHHLVVIVLELIMNFSFQFATLRPLLLHLGLIVQPHLDVI